MPVERAEGAFEVLAALAEVQPPVGEHAVDVEDRGPDALRLQQQRERRELHGQWRPAAKVGAGIVR